MFYFSCYFTLLFVTVVTCQNTQEVEISLGKIEGTKNQTAAGEEYLSFEGVPYAEPPIGKLRFKEAVPPTPWKTTLKANKRYRCIHYNNPTSKHQIQGTEDCLYLNIYTKKLDDSLPVIVHIQGGGFTTGDDPDQALPDFLVKNVVLVTMNYRLGVLGFLSTEDENVPGNNGLRDQILALKWIQEHIKHFGGNPKSVTITGIADGAASVHFHYISPKSKGLFHKGISMSGCLLNPWVLKEKPLKLAKQFGGRLGCNLGNVKVMLACLREKPVNQLINEALKYQFSYLLPFSPFGIVIDKWSPDPLLPSHPASILQSEIVNDVPWMSSQTKDEGLITALEFYPIEEHREKISYKWTDDLPLVLHYHHTAVASHTSLVNDQIAMEYFEGSSDLNDDNFNNFIVMMGDRHFKAGIDMCTRFHASSAVASVYHYVFNYRGEHSWTEIVTGNKVNMGVCHGDDLAYVLKGSVDTQSTEEDKKVSNLMVDIFSNFAKFGKPSKDFKEWPRVTRKDWPIKYYEISSKPKIQQATEFGNRKFWESLTLIENELIYVKPSAQRYEL